MRKPGQGKPETCIKRREGPNDTVPGQSLLDMAVLRNIEIIIKVDEFTVLYLPECRKRQESEDQTDDDFVLPRIHKGIRYIFNAEGGVNLGTLVDGSSLSVDNISKSPGYRLSFAGKKKKHVIFHSYVFNNTTNNQQPTTND